MSISNARGRLPKRIPLKPSLRAALIVAAIAIPMLAEASTEKPSSGLRERPQATTDARAYLVHSGVMDRDYVVTVATPKGYDTHRERHWPVLFVTDGTFTLEITHGVWHLLEDEILQPVLVTLTSPPEEGFKGYVRRRIYEFSPPNWSLDDPFGREVAKVVPNCFAESTTDLHPCVGGAPRFFAFITTELLPALRQKYRIDDHDLGLFGDSAGGFFASWALLQGDERFKRFIIASPVMGYGNGVISLLEQQYAATHNDLLASVYIASGGLEQTDPDVEFVGRVVSGQAQFAAGLTSRHYPGLRLFSETHANFGHDDVWPLVLLRGLQLVYQRPPEDKAP